MKLESGEHIDWIDGLKGVFALVIVMCHLHMTFASVISDGFWFYRFPFSELSKGGIGVAVFICLSAIIMTFKCGDTSKWQQILYKRYFRLALPLIPVLLLYGVLNVCGLLYQGQLSALISDGSLVPTPIHFKGFIKALLTTPFGGGSEYIGVLWMMGYIFATPFVVVIMNILFVGVPDKFKFIILSFCGLLAFILDPWFSAILAGYGIARYLQIENVSPSKMNPLKHLLILGALILLYVGVHYSSISDSGIATLKGVIVILFVINSSSCKKLFSIRPVKWLGGISFEIYLLHLLIIYSLGCWLYLSVPYVTHRLIYIYISIIISSVLAAYGWSVIVNRPVNAILVRIESLIKKSIHE